MTRSLNIKCDFKNGFLSCHLLVDTAQVSVHVDTKRGKHTLREDSQQRIERYQTWIKHNDDPRQILDSMTVSDLLDSGNWLSSPEPNYRPKFLMTPETQTQVKKRCPHLT